MIILFSNAKMMPNTKKNPFELTLSSLREYKIITYFYSLYLVMKILPHVMRNINEFNIPAGNSHGYEILYFGVNLILMFEYRLSFDIKVQNSVNEIEILILGRKDISSWK